VPFRTRRWKRALGSGDLGAYDRITARCWFAVRNRIADPQTGGDGRTGPRPRWPKANVSHAPTFMLPHEIKLVRDSLEGGRKDLAREPMGPRSGAQFLR
jgi:hypothetical protein